MKSKTSRALAVLSLRSALVLLLVSPFLPAGARQEPPPPGRDVIAIVGATVVDGTGREPFRATVIVRGERIAAVGRDVEIPSGARVIRAEGQTLLPGLFDLHTHLPYASAPRVTGDWPKNLKAYLYSGVTSVVDFGTYPETFEPMRRLVSTGAVEGPRIHFAARMTTPGGHGAEGGRGDFFTLEVQTPRAARAAVRRVLPYRPDAIKVFTDGWRYDTAPDMTSMNEETLAAIVDEAHKNGIEVLTHTVTLEGAKIAARAGVDVIAHGVGDREADKELVELMRAKGTTYVSTLAVYEPRGRDILSPLLAAVLEPAVRAEIMPPLTEPRPPQDDAEAVPTQQAPTEAAPAPSPNAPEAAPARASETARRRRWRNLLHNISALNAAGVRFGAGTDAGVTNTHHGWATLRELLLLVRGGLTPLQAITAATLESAKALHVEGERGSIETGKLADLLLVAGEPHKKIGDIERISRVFLGGREVDREKLAREIATTEQTPLSPVKVGERVDDFEPDGGNGAAAGGAAVSFHADTLRSDLGTLWVNGTDGGHDHSQILLGRTARNERDHALSVIARMSSAERPFARATVPLTRGAVEPADARGWRGVRFDARGDGGSYRLLIPTRGARDGADFQATFEARPKWQTIRIDFASLKQEETKTPAAWTGADLLLLSFEVARPPGALGWLELDNVRFYK